jgi:hypothetical protein
VCFTDDVVVGVLEFCQGGVFLLVAHVVAIIVVVVVFVKIRKEKTS